MGSDKNGRWIMPFKKFGMIRVKLFNIVLLFDIKSSHEHLHFVDKAIFLVF